MNEAAENMENISEIDQRDFSAVGGVEFFVVRFCFAVVIVFYPMYT